MDKHKFQGQPDRPEWCGYVEDGWICSAEPDSIVHIHAVEAVAPPDDREAQRRSFAYGNTKISNERITREMVDEAAAPPGTVVREAIERLKQAESGTANLDAPSTWEGIGNTYAPDSHSGTAGSRVSDERLKALAEGGEFSMYPTIGVLAKELLALRDENALLKKQIEEYNGDVGRANVRPKPHR